MAAVVKYLQELCFCFCCSEAMFSPEGREAGWSEIGSEHLGEVKNNNNSKPFFNNCLQDALKQSNAICVISS